MNRAQRWACLAGVVIALWAIARASVPFDERTGRYVYQRVHCSAPIVRVTRPQNNVFVPEVSGGAFAAPAGFVEDKCWEPAMQRVVTAGVTAGLTTIGTLAALLLLRQPKVDATAAVDVVRESERTDP